MKNMNLLTRDELKDYLENFYDKIDSFWESLVLVSSLLCSYLSILFFIKWMSLVGIWILLFCGISFYLALKSTISKNEFEEKGKNFKLKRDSFLYFLLRKKNKKKELKILIQLLSLSKKLEKEKDSEAFLVSKLSKEFSKLKQYFIKNKIKKLILSEKYYDEKYLLETKKLSHKIKLEKEKWNYLLEDLVKEKIDLIPVSFLEELDEEEKIIWITEFDNLFNDLETVSKGVENLNVNYLQK